MRHCSAELLTEQFSWYIREQRKTGKSGARLEFSRIPQIPVCGYVLNGVQEGTTGYGYSSYGGYGYENMVTVTERYGYGKEKERRNSDRTAREQGGKA